MDKQNKAVRQKRKKEEMTRLRTLVGMYVHLFNWCVSYGVDL